MLFWIPAIFIVIELIYIGSLPKVISLSNIALLSKKYKSDDLDKYIEKKYNGFSKLMLVSVLFILFETVYFIVGLFYSIWMFSIVFILFLLFSTVISTSRKKEKDLGKIVKRANLEDFETSDIKLSRALKMNEIKNVKTNDWTLYIYPIIKVLAFLAIIILHYHFQLL